MKTLAAMLLGGFAMMAHGAPPQVTNSVPDRGSKEVDPKSKELRVVFDQPMGPGGMSVVGGGSTFPKFVGRPRWENERTFVWAWQLESNHDYWLSLNSEKFRNFRSASGESAVPYPISFRTAAGSSQPRDSSFSSMQNASAVAHLKRAILEDYSYHDLRGVDWESRFGEFSNKLAVADTPAEFGRIAAELLAPARDIHLWLQVDGRTIPTHRRIATWNVNLAALPKRVPRWRERNAIVSAGEFDDGIRYLSIRSWPAKPEDLAPAFEVLAAATKSSRALIVDVRANGGGAEMTARQFAGCFVDRPVAYAKHATRSAGKFSEPQTRMLEPNKAHATFTNRVAVLAGAGTVSSSESFVLMMQNARCIVVGERTAGTSGNPMRVDLGNGVTAHVPSWKTLDLAGEPLEGKGVAPTARVQANPKDFLESDPVLDEALKRLRSE